MTWVREVGPVLKAIPTELWRGTIVASAKVGRKEFRRETCCDEMGSRHSGDVTKDGRME